MDGQEYRQAVGLHCLDDMNLSLWNFNITSPQRMEDVPLLKWPRSFMDIFSKSPTLAHQGSLWKEVAV